MSTTTRALPVLRTTRRRPDDRKMLLQFQALAEETRLEIVRRLRTGERCVCELQDELDSAQSRLSFHLRKLKEAGLIADRREGRWIYYRLVPEALAGLRAFLGEVQEDAAACC